MRLSLFLLFFTTLSVSAGTDIMAQKMSLQIRDAELRDVLRSIREQTGYVILYSDSRIEQEKKRFTLDMQDAELTAVLDRVLAGLPFTYDIADRTVMIILSPEKATQAPRDVTVGGVVREQSGRPLTGATVVLKNTSRGTLTDVEGRFILTVPDTDNMVLVVSYLGKITAEVAYTGQTDISVTLQDKIEEIADIVVTGYQTLSRETAPGAFSRVDGGMVTIRHPSDVSSMLLGTVAGMQGRENADGTVDYIIRGVSTLGTDKKPLIVIDGFPVENGFADINPLDVESITVLKDAVAASIWGARSANGVIVVVTKRAAGRGAGMNVDVSAKVRIGSKTDLSTVYPFASAADQVAYEKRAYDNGWILTPFTGTFTDSFFQSLTMVGEQYYARRDGDIDQSQYDAALAKLAGQDNRGQIKEYLLENPILQQYNLSLSHSGERSGNYVSAMYERGVGSTVNNSYDRLRVNYNSQWSLFRWLDLSFSSNLHYNKADNSGPSFSEINALSPYELIFDENGEYAEQLNGVNRKLKNTVDPSVLPYPDWTYNILRDSKSRKFISDALNTRLQIGLTFKIIEGLNFATSFQYEYNKSEEEYLYKEDSYAVRNYVNTHVQYNGTSVTQKSIPNGAFLDKSYASNTNYMWRNQIDFNYTFASRHTVSSMAGMEIHEYKFDSFRSPRIWGYDVDRGASAGLTHSGLNVGRINSSYTSQLNNLYPSFGYRLDHYVSVYGNVSYSLDSKYTVSGSIRSDASNLITDNSSMRWSPFWSVGAMWNIYKENFMKGNSAWLDRLMLRLTYGFNGNADKSSSPLTLVGMSSSPSSLFGAYTTSITNFGNPDLRWERTGTFNFGIDFSMLKNTLFGSINAYNKRSKDVLGNFALASVYGTNSQKLNSAKISNKGFEVELGVRTLINPAKLSIISKITYAYNKNKIEELNDPSIIAHEMLGSFYSPYYYNSGAYVKDYAVDGLFTYKYLGMVDGVPSVAGPGGKAHSIYDVALHNTGIGLDFLEYHGAATAPHTLGWHTTFSAFGFELSFFLNGTFGGKFRGPSFLYPLMINTKQNIPVWVNEALAGSDRFPSWPEANSANHLAWERYVPYFDTLIESSSFIKLKEINLAYTLPAKLTRSMGLNGASVFVQARNLGCIWKDNDYGYDPEWLPGTAKPSTTWLFGVNINF